MRRLMFLMLGVVSLCTALPQGAKAEPQSLPGAVFGLITRPIGAVLGTLGHAGRALPQAGRHEHDRRRAAAPRPRPIGRHATSHRTTKPTAARAPETTGSGSAAVATSGAATMAVVPTPLPVPAPKPRSAALSLPGAALSLPSEEFQAPREPAPSAGREFAHEGFGVAGPLAWPTAYQDIIGYTLWPASYGGRLRVHGLGDVLSAILAPTTAASAHARTDFVRTADTRSDYPAIAACGTPDQAAPDWPSAEIERSIDLTPTQRAALDEMRAAIGQAIASIRANCRNMADMTPIERVNVLQNTLWAVRDAAILIRAPLAKFYESLTDDQKQPFVVATSSIDPQAAPARGFGRTELSRMCGMSKQSEASMRQLARELRPNAAQRASFEALQKITFEMGQFLMASCLQPVPSTPAARLDAAADRLTAVIFAATHIGLALNDFYNQLSDQQKERFNIASH